MMNAHNKAMMIIIIFTLLFPYIALAIDTITPRTPLTINQTLVSNDQSFELGFFNFKDTSTSYVGIWYKNITPKTYVWVANRDAPITSMSGFLAIGEDSNVIILDEHQNTVWSSNSFVGSVKRPRTVVAQLLDSGNFVIRRENDDNPSNYLWQSFENPTDTLLPGMKLGWNRKTGTNLFLRSWKTDEDPGSGDYDLKMDTDGLPEIIIWKNGIQRYRSGAWNGKQLSGVPVMKITNNSVTDTEFLDTSDEISYSFKMLNNSVYSRLSMTSTGKLRRYIWINSVQTWIESWFVPQDRCDFYKQCGPYGICDTNSSLVNCTCMKGFVPKIQQAWDLGDGSDGCVRSSKLDCGSDGFLKMNYMKLPESSKVFVDQTMNLATCGAICKRNCSCVAYANMDITQGGSGCVIWKGDLIDMRRYADSDSKNGGQELYIRVAASDLVSSSTTTQASGKGSKNHFVMIVTIILSVSAVIIIILVILIVKELKDIGKGTPDSPGSSKGTYATGNFESTTLPLADYYSTMS